MSLLKFFLSEIISAAEAKADDPLAHPEIAAMSQRELADLPLPYPASRQPARERQPLPKCA
jgi:hypothetical protein